MNIELRSVSKRFGSVIALDDVSFSVQSGQVTCLLGDNGAGKSTLIRILSGVYAPTSGRYLIDGDDARFDSPRDALSRGIATVHQDLGLVPLLSIWRNFFLGAEPKTGRLLPRIDVVLARATASSALQTMGITVRDADEPVAMLSGGERQSIAIARALHRGARVLILDEPTAALGVRQAALVLRNIAEAAKRGVAVVLVTHNPAHALEVADRLVVLKQGKVRRMLLPDETDAAGLAELMA